MSTASAPLLVFAHADEAQAFTDVPHLVTGIGKINSTVALSKRLGEGGVSEIIVLGTAGMIDDRLNVDNVYRVAAAVQHDFELPTATAVISEAGAVELIDPHDWADRAHEVAAQGGDTAMIATGDIFVNDNQLRNSLIAQGAQLVDMESYAYALTAHTFNVPIRIFKVPSDSADDSTTHEEWDTVVVRKSEALRQFAREQGLL